jgi:hypothetical protein
MGNCCCAPPPVVSEIAITGTPEDVRRWLLDGKSFPEWNPLYIYFNVVKGNFDDFYDSRPKATQIVVKTEVYIRNSKATLQVTKNQRTNIIWTTAVLAEWIMLATVTNDFKYDPNTNVTVYHREEGYTGLIAGLSMCLIRSNLQNLADKMLVNLKAQVEKSNA